MNFEWSLQFFLQAGMGLLWIGAYILIIWRGFIDKTFGMPMVAICANISWEFIYSFVYPHEGYQRIVNIIWLLLDIIIVLQYLHYGKKEFGRFVNSKYFVSSFLLSLITSFTVIIAIAREFGDFQGMYAAFSQNLMMSVLFITLLTRRGNVNGQSMHIAIFKMLGSLSAGIVFYLNQYSLLVTVLATATFIFDGLYTMFLYKMFCKIGINPWKRAKRWKRPMGSKFSI